MSSDVVAAFFAGIGAVLGSAGALWLTRRHAEKECEQRMQALREGYKMGHDG